MKLPIRLPSSILCPRCNQLSLRLLCNGDLKFPPKNYSLLWMIESMAGNRSKARFASCMACPRRHVPHYRHADLPESNCNEGHAMTIHFNSASLQRSVRKSLATLAHLTKKFPLVMSCLVILLSLAPTSAAILGLYLLVTIVFVVPAGLVLYFALPSLNWLLGEMLT